MQAKLVVVEPQLEPSEYNINLPLTIGRGREATLKLPHALVSREHCELFEDRGRIMVRDLGSLNGTFVSGQRVETAPLLPGDLLTVGSVTLRAIYGDEMLLAPPAGAVQGEPAAVDTVSLEDTAQATYRQDEEEEAGEPLTFGEDEDTNDFFRNLN